MGVFDFCHGKSTEPTGCPDVPIADIKDDRFNVGQYINGLSSFILTCDTPMTVSIQGDWGSGKTSMMNMVDANIRNLALPIWFNTWQFSQFSLGNFGSKGAISKSRKYKIRRDDASACCCFC